jgi:hypothetical protein
MKNMDYILGNDEMVNDFEFISLVYIQTFCGEIMEDRNKRLFVY